MVAYAIMTHAESSLVNVPLHSVIFGLLQLGPWLAVEIPEMIEKGVVTYKEKQSGDS